jgi:glucose-6-phosphate 1-dehydrogenase
VTTPDNFVIVLFGATGDLAARKLLPGFFRLAKLGLMPEDFRIIGSARHGITDEEFRDHAHQVVDQFGRLKPADGDWSAFSDRLSFVTSSADDMGGLATAVADARTALGSSSRTLCYLSIPPVGMAGIVKGLGTAGIADEATRVVLEKPFGTDEDSAKALNALLHSVFAEDQIFRIDHFLGKEDVQNVLAVRFANGLFEPVWNNRHIDSIYIDVPETLGVEDRAKFYDGTGAFRDMVVTHLFQVLGFVTMEPPAGFTSDALAAEKQRVFRALQPLDPKLVVRGQYDGYRDIDGIAQDSDTDTLVAVEARIDNGRWDGVPIFLRTGKRMPESRTVIALTLRLPPMEMFEGLTEVHRNEIVFEIGDQGSIRLVFQSKQPGPDMVIGPAHLDFSYGQGFDPRCELEAYESLMHDVMLGDHTLFNRAEGIERLWEVSAPLLAAPPPVLPYAQGTWGPKELLDLPNPRHWYLPEPDAPTT